jgi:hypothetical protein
MRILLTGILGAVILTASLASAPAASTCTAWVDYSGNDDNTCVSFIKSRTSGHSPQVSGDTIYFWSGDNVAAARCISEHAVIVLFAWNHADQPAACNSYQWLKSALQPGN